MLWSIMVYGAFACTDVSFIVKAAVTPMTDSETELNAEEGDEVKHRFRRVEEQDVYCGPVSEEETAP